MLYHAKKTARDLVLLLVFVSLIFAAGYYCGKHVQAMVDAGRQTQSGQ